MDGPTTRSSAGLLALTALRGIGPATAERLAQEFISLTEISEADPIRLRVFAPKAVVELLKQRTALYEGMARAARILQSAEQQGVRVISVFDPDYPSQLRKLSDRPPVLFVKGQFSNIDRSVACIGTREPSIFGFQVSQRIVEQLVNARWTIVSGLAVGVDTSAHRAAIELGGQTIAVMAGGLDSIYPKQNSHLAQEILATGGALVSEQPFGSPPTPHNLVQRDRLQSGLSVATIVMQTDVVGGSMHTVRFTLQQGRLLFAPVPPGRHANEPKSQGLLALTQAPGPKFASMISAQGEYLKLLLAKYATRPVAIPLASRDDYVLMLDTLEAGLSDQSRTDVPSSQTKLL